MKKQYYTKGFLFFMIHLAFSCGNDALTRFLVSIGDAKPLHFWEVAFFRAFFATLSIGLHGLLRCPKKELYTDRKGLHMIRGAGFVMGSGLWCYGLSCSTVTIATVAGFTMPLISIFFSRFFLRERVTYRLVFFTVLGIVGACLIRLPDWQVWHFHFDGGVIAFLMANVCFAFVDVLSKRYIGKESMFAMAFYSIFFAMLFSLPFACYFGHIPTFREFCLLFCLGIGGNLVYYSLLHSFQYAPLSFLAPFRFLELFLAIAVDAVIFGEKVPTQWWGGLLIAPAIFFVIYEHYGEKSLVKGG